MTATVMLFSRSESSGVSRKLVGLSCDLRETSFNSSEESAGELVVASFVCPVIFFLAMGGNLAGQGVKILGAV